MRPDFADTSGRRQRAATEHRGGVTAWLWPITSRPRLPLGEAWMYTCSTELRMLVRYGSVIKTGHGEYEQTPRH